MSHRTVVKGDAHRPRGMAMRKSVVYSWDVLARQVPSCRSLPSSLPMPYIPPTTKQMTKSSTRLVSRLYMLSMTKTAA